MVRDSEGFGKPLRKATSSHHRKHYLNPDQFLDRAALLIYRSGIPSYPGRRSSCHTGVAAPLAPLLFASSKRAD
jgi:hypothetical protein